MPSSSKTSGQSFCSVASTIQFSQTPFAEFSWQVHQLCKQIWPDSYDNIHIEYLSGGSTNRVIGISFPSLDHLDGHKASELSTVEPLNRTSTTLDSLNLGFSQSAGDTRYVLRIARFPQEIISGGVASLDYVSQYASVPVPRLVAHDLTPENAVGSPYSLQYRIPGMPLISVHPHLTHHQQQDLAKEVARVLLGFREIESPHAGRVDYLKSEEQSIIDEEDDEDDDDEKDATADRSPQMARKRTPKILHFDLLSDDDPYNGKVSTLDDCNALGVISFQFARLIISSVPTDRSSNFQATYIIRLLAIAREMEELGVFGYESMMTLYHDDFETRNIMVTIDNDEYGTLKISGVLDWDDVIFAPPFMSSLPPRWLWSDVYGNVSQEPSTYEDPADPELLRVKKIFDAYAGWEFTRYSYEPQYRLARRLFRLAFSGFCYNEDFEAADALLAEWEELRPKLFEMQNAEIQARESETDELEVDTSDAEEPRPEMPGAGEALERLEEVGGVVPEKPEAVDSFDEVDNLQHVFLWAAATKL